MLRRPALFAAVACAATLAVVGAGVALSGDPSPRKPAARQTAVPTQVPLSELDLTELDAVREPFCDQVTDEQATSAVGGSATETEYVSGEHTDLEPGLSDVSHEFGCSFAFGSTTARAWVFAAPVQPREARGMVRNARRTKGCVRTGPLVIGRPGVVQICTDGEHRVLRGLGLLGDSWIHCELTTPVARADSSFVVRGQRWCADAVLAMSS